MPFTDLKLQLFGSGGIKVLLLAVVTKAASVGPQFLPRLFWFSLLNPSLS